MNIRGFIPSFQYRNNHRPTHRPVNTFRHRPARRVFHPPARQQNFVNRALTSAFQAFGQAFPQGENAVSRLASDPNSSTLVSLLGGTDLLPAVQSLEENGPITVLAPTNAAFDRLAQEQPDLFGKLTDPANQETLQAVLLYHASAEPFGFGQGATFDSLLENDHTRFAGNPFQGGLLNGDQRVRTGVSSLSANGSVVIPINQVLIPPDFDPSVLV